MSDTLTRYETSPGALIVAIIDALKRRPLPCSGLTLAIFGPLHPASPEFVERYNLVFRWLERMEADGGVIRRKGKAAVLWELAE